MNNYDYPPGSDHSGAPWNQEPAKDCPTCSGTGKIPEYFCLECEKTSHDDPDYCPFCGDNDLEKIGEKWCDQCGGNGTVA